MSLSRLLASAGVLLLLGGCGSSGRAPATAGVPADAVMDATEETAESAPAAADARGAASAGGLTDDEILARAPESSVRSESLDVASMTLAELNALAPLEDVHFNYDSADLSAEAQAILTRHAEWLRRHGAVSVQIEGHCDERGTVEYNLALGDLRARSVRDFLAQLDIASNRLRTISFGKEVPLDPARNEQAWRRNRRAHFVVVAK